MSVAIAIAPVIHAADQEPIHMAKRSGGVHNGPYDSQKTVTGHAEETPVEKPKNGRKTPDAATESEPISIPPYTSASGLLSYWQRPVAVGGGGGSSTPPHP
jgi:hypothetical protein